MAAYLIYIMLCLIWGSTWLAIKIGLEDSPPLWSAGLRFVIAAIILFIINSIKRVPYPRDWKTIRTVAFPGIFMYSLSYMLVYWGETHIGSAMMAVLYTTFPFFVAAFAAIMLKDERLSPLAWGGLVIGFGGVIVIFFDSLNISQLAFGGTVAGVASSASSAFATVYIRAKLRETPIRMMASLQITLGAILIIIFAALLEPPTAFRVTTKSVSALLYLSVFGTVIAFLAYYWLLRRMHAVTVSLMTFFIPVIAIALGYAVRAETFSYLAVVGTVLILAGVVLVVKK
ncbi:MAG: EamA family transporter [candidate division Zixibacteria bacterium]|nr:EamA family transporter [candidate division Zixibacteria bacterium]